MEMTKSEKLAHLKDWFKKTKVDAAVVKRTVGVDTDSITPQLLLHTAKKLIAINKHEEEPDDRDDLRFAKILSIEDHIEEHIMKDAGKVQMNAKMKMEKRKNLDFLHAGFFSPQIRSVVVGNSLAQSAEGTNPMESLDLAHKYTKFGEGAISSAIAAPDESRQVQSSSFGFIDALKIPETTSMGLQGFLCAGLRKGDDNKLYKEMINDKGKHVWVDHETILNSKCEIPEF